LVFSSDISWDARDFVECLIKKAPEERRRADQLLSHPFLEKHLEVEYMNIKI
jgi:serine/threonine protein kinase